MEENTSIPREYQKRLVDVVLTDAMARLPAISLIGPRASGKTTTAARHAASIVRLDRPAEAAIFRADPDAGLRWLTEPILLDEWQEDRKYWGQSNAVLMPIVVLLRPQVI